MSRPFEPCQACPVHEERELRAFLADVDRLPVGPLVNASLNDVLERMRRLRTAEKHEVNERHDQLLRSLDSLVQRVRTEDTVERLALARQAERDGRDRQQEQDEAWWFAQAGAAA